MNIKNATPDDALRIATIHVKTWQCAYKGQVSDSYLDSLSIEKRTKTWKDQIQNPKEGEFTFVAEEDGHIVGWCTAGGSRDEDASKEVGELYGIYIDSDYMGKGIGTKLMEHALNLLRKEGYTKATLWVLDTNENSKKFYEKRGWKSEGKTKIDKRDDFELLGARYINELI